MENSRFNYQDTFIPDIGFLDDPINSILSLGQGSPHNDGSKNSMTLRHWSWYSSNDVQPGDIPESPEPAQSENETTSSLSSNVWTPGEDSSGDYQSPAHEPDTLPGQSGLVDREPHQPAQYHSGGASSGLPQTILSQTQLLAISEHDRVAAFTNGTAAQSPLDQDPYVVVWPSQYGFGDLPNQTTNWTSNDISPYSAPLLGVQESGSIREIPSGYESNADPAVEGSLLSDGYQLQIQHDFPGTSESRFSRSTPPFSGMQQMEFRVPHWTQNSQYQEMPADPAFWAPPVNPLVSSASSDGPPTFSTALPTRTAARHHQIQLKWCAEDPAKGPVKGQKRGRAAKTSTHKSGKRLQREANSKKKADQQALLRAGRACLGCAQNKGRCGDQTPCRPCEMKGIPCDRFSRKFGGKLSQKLSRTGEISFSQDMYPLRLAAQNTHEKLQSSVGRSVLQFYEGTTREIELAFALDIEGMAWRVTEFAGRERFEWRVQFVDGKREKQRSSLFGLMHPLKEYKLAINDYVENVVVGRYLDIFSKRYWEREESPFLTKLLQLMALFCGLSSSAGLDVFPEPGPNEAAIYRAALSLNVIVFMMGHKLYDATLGNSGGTTHDKPASPVMSMQVKHWLSALLLEKLNYLLELLPKSIRASKKDLWMPSFFSVIALGMALEKLQNAIYLQVYDHLSRGVLEIPCTFTPEEFAEHTARTECAVIDAKYDELLQYMKNKFTGNSRGRKPFTPFDGKLDAHVIEFSTRVHALMREYNINIFDIQQRDRTRPSGWPSAHFDCSLVVRLLDIFFPR